MLYFLQNNGFTSEKNYSLDFGGQIKSLGIYNISEKQLKVYPNPAKDIVCIKTLVEVEKVQLVTISGQLVSEQSTSGNKTEINTSEFETGVYFVIVFSSNNIITKKLVIE
ncbi:MAG: T9SS type A sorting domain-containing protein [Bacteroidales bacterium]|nr:T9SS type A sorting domain-containing protein [Bacteroidales bacterium]